MPINHFKCQWIPYDPAIPLEGIYQKRNINLKNIHIPLFTALFRIAKIWKQPKCPSTDEWIKKLRNIYTHIYTHI